MTAHRDGVDVMTANGYSWHSPIGAAARAAEFGTLKRPATPWLWPIFRPFTGN